MSSDSASSVSLSGRRIVITGATSGIGRVTAIELGRLGAELIIVARDGQKADATLRELEKVQPAGAVEPVALLADLSLMGAVRTLSAQLHKRYDRIDVLVNNAGAIFYDRQLTADGLESTFALNHMSYFLLTNLLLDLLRKSQSPRVVNVSSQAHRVAKLDLGDLQGDKRWSPFRSYAVSKLENLLFTFELARRAPEIATNAVHPGAVASGFGSGRGLIPKLVALARPFMLSAQKGARTSIWLASAPELDGQSGGYYKQCKRIEPSAEARDVELGRRLWDESAKLAGLPAQQRA